MGYWWESGLALSSSCWPPRWEFSQPPLSQLPVNVRPSWTFETTQLPFEGGSTAGPEPTPMAVAQTHSHGRSPGCTLQHLQRPDGFLPKGVAPSSRRGSRACCLVLRGLSSSFSSRDTQRQRLRETQTQSKREAPTQGPQQTGDGGGVGQAEG